MREEGYNFFFYFFVKECFTIHIFLCVLDFLSIYVYIIVVYYISGGEPFFRAKISKYFLMSIWCIEEIIMTKILSIKRYI